MKLKSLIAFISFATFTSLISSCGDSYAPITLTSVDRKTVYYNNDTISLDKFSKGEQFSIKGGDGYYYAKVTNKNNSEIKIIRHTIEDNLLTIIPENEGFSFLNIKDSEKNESRIIVEVEKIDKFYDITNLTTKIEGFDDFTDGERKKLTEDITINAFVKVGGKIEFEYENPNNGVVKIKADNYSEYKTGTFSQEKIYNTENGNEILAMNINIPGKDLFTLSLSETDLTIIEDLTDKYKAAHPNLKSAKLVYNLSVQTETPNNEK